MTSCIILGVARRFFLFLIASISGWTAAGCRFSFEVAYEDALGGAGPGGALGDGDDAGGPGKGSAGDSDSGAGGATDGSSGSPGGDTGGSSASGGINGGGGPDSGGSSASGGSGESGGTAGSEVGSGGTGGEVGSGGTVPVVGDFVVDTGSDEDDGSAVMGSGLSLREAIIMANAQEGMQTITFGPDVEVVTVLRNLPNIDEAVQIIGTQNTIDALNQGDTQPTLYAAADIVMRGLEIRNSPREPVFVNGGSSSIIDDCVFRDAGGPVYFSVESPLVSDSHFFGFSSDCLSLQGVNSVVRNNRFFDCAGFAIQLGSNADVAEVVGNLMVRPVTGLGIGTITSANLWFNTIAEPSGYGMLSSPSARGISFRNNIISGAASSAVNASDGIFAAFDHNLFFGNATDCNGCSTDATFVFEDPVFSNEGGMSESDFHIQIGSPAIDAGVLLEDRDDIGFWESN